MNSVKVENPELRIPQQTGVASPRLSVSNLTVGFGLMDVLQKLNFELGVGQTLAILGESGCGKTTLLRALTGLIPVRTGEILLDQQCLSGLPPKKRKIIYLDQEPLLFEHLTVKDNVAFAMRLQGINPKEIDHTVKEILEAIELGSHVNKREWQLSGGQKQRVAFARAILARPKVLLLDEPFCSLDSQTRRQMQTLYQMLRSKYELTSIFVTHDVKEALIVADRFARMTAGKLQFYPDRTSFITDKATGIPDEIAFWQRTAVSANE